MRTVLASLRLPFLLLTPMCVAVGLAAAWSSATAQTAGVVPVLPLGDALLVLMGALAAHASVNLFNEWFDFRSGLDAITKRTPFSGGSGALPARPHAASSVLLAAMLTFGACTVVGAMLLMRRGPELVFSLLPVGLAGLVLVVTYTPWITRSPLACLLAPGLGFGPLMVLGTELALTGHASAAGAWASLLPMATTSGLLLLNQFPDVDADRAVGRRHLPMVWGRPRAARLLALLHAVGYAAIVLAVVWGHLPWPALAATLLTLPLALHVAQGACAHADDLPALLPVMARNVALSLAAPLLLALGWAAAVACQLG